MTFERFIDFACLIFVVVVCSFLVITMISIVIINIIGFKTLVTILGLLALTVYPVVRVLDKF